VSFLWALICKECGKQFAYGRRDVIPGKRIDFAKPDADLGTLKCPHCGKPKTYNSADLVETAGEIADKRFPVD
jgi:DNA-directed RNA polymerase subunit RPC12/RpoP